MKRKKRRGRPKEEASYVCDACGDDGHCPYPFPPDVRKYFPNKRSPGSFAGKARLCLGFVSLSCVVSPSLPYSSGSAPKKSTRSSTSI